MKINKDTLTSTLSLSLLLSHSLLSIVLIMPIEHLCIHTYSHTHTYSQIHTNTDTHIYKDTEIHIETSFVILSICEWTVLHIEVRLGTQTNNRQDRITY